MLRALDEAREEEFKTHWTDRICDQLDGGGGGGRRADWQVPWKMSWKMNRLMNSPGQIFSTTFTGHQVLGGASSWR